MDKLHAMTVFVRIVEAGSLTGAATRLGTSLASVVRSLAGLEGALGVRLLNRTTRRIALTDEGREYFERCRRLLAEIDEAEAVLSDRRATPAGRLALTAPVMFGRLHVAPVAIDFMRRYPGVRIELVLLDRIVDLVDEGMDLAVRIGALPDSSLVATPLGATRRVVCASPDFLARQGVPAQPSDLAGRPCVRFTGLGRGAIWEFGDSGDDGSGDDRGMPAARRGGSGRGRRSAPGTRVSVDDAFVSNQIDTALAACTAGLGFGRFLAYQVRAALAGGELVRVLAAYEPPPVPVHLVCPHSRLLSSRVRTFIDHAAPLLRARLADVA